MRAHPHFERSSPVDSYQLSLAADLVKEWRTAHDLKTKDAARVHAVESTLRQLDQLNPPRKEVIA